MKNEVDEIQDLISQDPDLAESFERGRYAQRAARIITQMREAAGLEKAELAERLNVKRPRIYEAENPKGSDGPTYRFMSEVAEACGFRWPSTIDDLPPSVQTAQVTLARQYFLVEVDARRSVDRPMMDLKAMAARTTKVVQALLGAAASPTASVALAIPTPGLVDLVHSIFRGAEERSSDLGSLRIVGRVTIDENGNAVIVSSDADSKSDLKQLQHVKLLVDELSWISEHHEDGGN